MTKNNHNKSKSNALINGVKRCDARAQREMYNLLVLPMFNTCMRILKNREDAQDCLQIGFTFLFKKIEQYDPQKGAFSTWSTRNFINESLRILKRRKILFESLDDVVIINERELSPLESLQASDILKLINTLPDQMRVIFSLYEIEGYSHKEIAEMLGIAVSSSRTYLMRAKSKLKLMLEPAFSESLGTQNKLN